MLLQPMVAQQEVGTVLIHLHKHYQPSINYKVFRVVCFNRGVFCCILTCLS